MTLTENQLQAAETWQAPMIRGSNHAEYDIYAACADNGTGMDITTGLPLKTFDEWLNS